MIGKGRFDKSAAETAQRCADSVSFDWRFYRYELQARLLTARALERAGLITATKYRKIENGLRAI
jgi:argininosuccinate lyase